MYLTNLEITHPGATDLIDKGVIGAARSLVPGCLSAIDKTMEETFMKYSKGTGGLLGIFDNYSAYQRWCRTKSARGKLFEDMLEMCGLINDPDIPKAGKHRELHYHNIKKSEWAVKSVIKAICNFTNPWRIANKNRLYTLASGAPVPPAVEDDVLSAESLGISLKEQFIKERLEHSSEKNFYDPLPRQKLKTMEFSNKTVILTTTQGKFIQYNVI